MKKNCDNCGEEILQRTRHRRRFCTRRCKEKLYHREEATRRRELRKEIVCAWCNETTIPKGLHGKTCGGECAKQYRQKTRLERAKEYVKRPERIKRHREYHREYTTKRRKDDPIFNLNHRMVKGIRRSLKGMKKPSSTFNLLNYTPQELMSHLESQFTNGMSWDNMSEWHIDHIRPFASFNFDSTDHPDFKKCWALNNLQPLWAKDNISKGKKWDGVVNA